MHNIKQIRKETDFFSKKIKNRNTKISLENILELDKKKQKINSEQRKT